MLTSLGMLSGPITADYVGRKANLFILSVILILGIVLELVAKSPQVWLVARLFAGWGTGMVQTGIPVYISEIA
jgi:MFS family permease